MGAFIARRLLWLLLVLFVVSVITFVLMHAIPGGPYSAERAVPEQTLRALNERYHLDDPLLKQYLDYMSAVIVPRITFGELAPTFANDYLINIPLPFGDNAHLRWMNFGPSYKSRSRTVNDIFRDNLPVSFQLGLAALLVAMAIGIPLGTMAALRRNSPYDYLSMSVAIIGVSVPVIILGPILQYTFAVNLRWLPVTGWGGDRNWSALEHMVLPAVALGLANSALLARLTRASLLQVLHEDYITTARSKGLPESRVISIHAMKNAMIPVVTVLGPLFAALVTGTFVTETIFNIPGMGRFFVTSITGRDYTVIMGTILLYAVFLVIANLVVDLVYAFIDPRIRYS